MSFPTVMILVIIMCIGMIAMVMWYLKKGYSYKHTVDELPDPVKEMKKEE